PRLAALRPDHVRRLLRGGQVAVHHAHVRPLASQHEGGGPTVADALTGRLPASHHDGGLALDALGHGPHSSTAPPRAAQANPGRAGRHLRYTTARSSTPTSKEDFR